MTTHKTVLVAALAWAFLGAAACADTAQQAPGAVGEACTLASDCSTSLCVAGTCRDPRELNNAPPNNQPAPNPNNQPEPQPDPNNQPEPDPEPDPEPQPDPEPDPDPNPGCTQDSDCEGEQVCDRRTNRCVDEPITDPDPEPEPDPDPEPDPEPEPDPAPEPVDCSALEGQWSLCQSSATTCGVVFEDGAGCDAVCAAAGLVCLQVYENLDDQCAPDAQRPALGCQPQSGHQSDYCVCGRDDCVPSCQGRQCGDNGCGGSCGQCNDQDNSACTDAGQCLCEPSTCASAGLECGNNHDDGCGGTFDCPGSCPIGVECTVGLCGAPQGQCTDDFCPAFPGAEGEGMFARGGRGGSVCHVTNTNNSGSGSFRDCATTGSGPLTIVFDVGGIIDLTSPLTIRRDRLTIAGQTAPGDGIVVRGYQTDIRGDNLIIQHIRFRAGDIRKKTRNSDGGFTEDSLTVTGTDIIIDHVSASWGIDECLSAGSAINNLTVQYSIISEGLHRTRLFHGEYDADHGGHSMGSLFKPSQGNGEISVHHNLYAHNNNRNPAVGVYDDGQHIKADIRNNVVYNCRAMGYVSGGGGRADVNYIGNYGVFGPDNSSQDLFKGNSSGVDVNLYQSGNFIDTTRNGRFDGRDRGWSSMGSDYDRQSNPYNLREVTTHAAPEALEIVLENAGARPWNRDEVDERVVQDVRSGTGNRIDSQDEVGGWGTVRSGSRVTDSDRDGMPDDWERTHGTNPNNADHNGDRNADGYTNLENYLHWAGRNR